MARKRKTDYAFTFSKSTLIDFLCRVNSKVCFFSKIPFQYWLHQSARAEGEEDKRSSRTGVPSFSARTFSAASVASPFFSNFPSYPQSSLSFKEDEKKKKS